MNTSESLLSLTPHLPTYSQARAFLEVMQRVSYLLYRGMHDQIREQAGSPQETVDWTNPPEWISQRLTGEERTLALKIWQDTRGLVNPRHTRGCWYLANKHELLERDSGDLLQITVAGWEFINEPEGERVALIDRDEGLLNILQIGSEHSPGKRSDILPDYAEFCDTYTNYRSLLSVYISRLYLPERACASLQEFLVTPLQRECKASFPKRRN